MSDDLQRSRVEAMLRAAGDAGEVPDSLHAVARDAALASGDPAPQPVAAVVRMPRRRRFEPARLAAAAVVLVGTAAASIVIGVGGASQSPAVVSTIALSGAHGMTGKMEVSGVSGGMRQVVFSVDHLPPAPAGDYYEAWYQSGAEAMTLATFDTPSSGHVQLRTTMPAALGWSRCWVTLESVHGGRSRVVLDSVRST